MITIQSAPQKFTPAFNPVVFSITSDNYAQPDFKFVADVYSDSGVLLASLKYQPQVVGTDPVSIDVGRILHELVAANYLRLNSVVSPAIVVTGGGAIAGYSVQFGEQYNNIVHANLISSSGYVFNGAVEQLRFAFYNQSTYLNTQFLTHFPRQTVRKRDSVLLSQMQSDITAITQWTLLIYDAVGNQIYTANIPNPYTSLAETNNRLLHLHVGFDSLYSVMGFSSTVYNNAAYYKIRTSGGQEMRYDLSSQCDRFPGIRLHFLNQLGGFDSFNFRLANRPSQTTERKRYLRQPANRTTAYSAADKRFEVLSRSYYTRTTQKQHAISDYLYDREAQLLTELFSTPLAYMEADASAWGGGGMVLVPVDLTTLEYEIKSVVKDKLFTVELDLEVSADNYGQKI